MKQDKTKIISAKDLGELKLAEFCPRCFWLKRRLGSPPSVFPGIFSTLDAVSKRSAHRSFEKSNKPPRWLPLEGLAGVEENGTYFKIDNAAAGWRLVGKPDDIFRAKKGGYIIVDYKTAKYTGKQDELFPMYHVQLNAYAYLLREYSFWPVEKLFLVYCEPGDSLDSDNDFKLPFATKLLEVKLDLELIPALLKKARRIVQRKKPPKAGKDCAGLCDWLGKAHRL